MAKQLVFSNRRTTMLLVLILALVLASTGIILYNIRDAAPLSSSNKQKDDGLMEADLERLSEDDYDSVLLSMHSTASFREEDFIYYRGLHTLVASHALLNTKELAEYLDCILNSGHSVNTVYLCLDPELLWVDSCKKSTNWDQKLQENLYNYIETNAAVTFEILLPYPYIDYWLELKDKDFNTLLTVYSTLTNQLCSYPNTKVFFPGMEYWVMVNPDNYTDSVFETNEIVTQKLFLYTFCDGDYRVTPENGDSYWNSLRETVERETASPTEYPDLSRWCLIFFGDSVFANYPGSYGIPGYVTGLSGAITYNYAIGGSSSSSFPGVVSGFLEEADTASDGTCVFSSAGNRKICFVIQYGFNDYFNGAPVRNTADPYDPATYTGALCTGISRLQAAFPDAEILVVTPTHTELFENGTSVMSEEGDVLSAYAKAAVETAQELDIFYLDNYNDFIITGDNLKTYVSDGVHPNEFGRLTIAAEFMDFIHKNME